MLQAAPVILHGEFDPSNITDSHHKTWESLHLHGYADDRSCTQLRDVMENTNAGYKSIDSSTNIEDAVVNKTADPCLQSWEANSEASGINYGTTSLDFSLLWANDKENIVRGPFEYSVAHLGKDFRTKFIHAFNAWLNIPPARLEIISHVINLLHESSLLIDDIQDSSQLRRGFPTAYRVFGVAQTLNSANYIYFRALQKVEELNNPAAVSVFIDEMVNLHRGQGLELYWRDSSTCPSEADYLEMIAHKTGGLLRLCARLMLAESQDRDVGYTLLANIIGIIYQIRDDLMNLCSEDYGKAKGMFEDITEGKFSLPILHSIRSNPGNGLLQSILGQKTADITLKDCAVRYIRSQGSFEYTRNVMLVLIERAKKMILEIDDGRNKSHDLLVILGQLTVS
ncbi:hypothetical protein NLG97_g336 [Lecanicillium saksenae]|uniref:Uncharacterized protein n=1 Tax=Lecanicillium saksenae TaxID=468837 RepID=A0ACC1R7I3_9HYPO|nr:hypothetical protein NLG97_g336 [Lecanicillium saksenae]